jgi:hypothetical protein
MPRNRAQELPPPRDAQRAAQAADLDAQKLSVRVTYMESEAKRTAQLLTAAQVRAGGGGARERGGGGEA